MSCKHPHLPQSGVFHIYVEVHFCLFYCGPESNMFLFGATAEIKHARNLWSKPTSGSVILRVPFLRSVQRGTKLNTLFISVCLFTFFLGGGGSPQKIHTQVRLADALLDIRDPSILLHAMDLCASDKSGIREFEMEKKPKTHNAVWWEHTLCPTIMEVVKGPFNRMVVLQISFHCYISCWKEGIVFVIVNWLYFLRSLYLIERGSVSLRSNRSSVALRCSSVIHRALFDQRSPHLDQVLVRPKKSKLAVIFLWDTS